jgi:hypothetical protein
MADASLDQYLTADLSNNTGADGWPISTFMYMVVPRDSNADCARSTDLANLVWWILSSAQAVNLANINFGTPTLTLYLVDNNNAYLTTSAVQSRRPATTCRGRCSTRW